MTLREKLLQICGFWPDDNLQKQVDVELYAQEYCRQKLSEGVGTIGPVNMPLEKDVLFRNAIQKFLLEKTRLGIPVLFHDEGCHGLMKDEATSFPMPIGIACCWDEELIQKIYDVVAARCAAAAGIRR